MNPKLLTIYMWCSTLLYITVPIYTIFPVYRSVTSSLFPPTAAIAVDYRTRRVFALSIVESTLLVLDAQTGVLLNTQSLTFASPHITVEETSGHIFIPSAMSNTIDMRDGMTGRLLHSIVLSQRPLIVLSTNLHSRVFVVIGTPTANGARIRSTAQIVVLDGTSGRVLRTVPLSVPDGRIDAVAIDSSRGHILISTSRTLVTVDAVSGASLHVRSTPQTISALVIDQKNNNIYAISAGEAPHGRIVRQATLSSINSRTGDLVDARSLGNVILVSATALIDAQLRRLVIASGLEPMGTTGFGGGVIVRDVDTGVTVRSMILGPSATVLALSPRTKHVFVAHFSSATQMLDVRTGAIVRTIPMQAQDIDIDQRTRRIFLTTGLAVYTIDAQTGSVVQTIRT